MSEVTKQVNGLLASATALAYSLDLVAAESAVVFTLMCIAVILAFTGGDDR